MKERFRSFSAEDTRKSCRRHLTRSFIAATRSLPLRYLRRTGRLSNLEAAVGTVLQIKPLLKGDPQGKIVCFAKLRGRQRAVEAIAKRYEELVVDAQDQTVGIAHADCAPDAQILASLLRRSSKPPKKILTVDYEPVTGSHVGPGALALFFLSDENVRNI